MTARCWPSGARGRPNWQVMANGGGHAAGASGSAEPTMRGTASWRAWMTPVCPQPLPQTPAPDTIAPLADDDEISG